MIDADDHSHDQEAHPHEVTHMRLVTSRILDLSSERLVSTVLADSFSEDATVVEEEEVKEEAEDEKEEDEKEEAEEKMGVEVVDGEEEDGEGEEETAIPYLKNVPQLAQEAQERLRMAGHTGSSAGSEELRPTDDEWQSSMQSTDEEVLLSQRAWLDGCLFEALNPKQLPRAQVGSLEALRAPLPLEVLLHGECHNLNHLQDAPCWPRCECLVRQRLACETLTLSMSSVWVHAFGVMRASTCTRKTFTRLSSSVKTPH